MGNGFVVPCGRPDLVTNRRLVFRANGTGSSSSSRSSFYGPASGYGLTRSTEPGDLLDEVVYLPDSVEEDENTRRHKTISWTVFKMTQVETFPHHRPTFTIYNCESAFSRIPSTQLLPIVQDQYL